MGLSYVVLIFLSLNVPANADLGRNDAIVPIAVADCCLCLEQKMSELAFLHPDLRFGIRSSVLRVGRLRKLRTTALLHSCTDNSTAGIVVSMRTRAVIFDSQVVIDGCMYYS